MAVELGRVVGRTESERGSSREEGDSPKTPMRPNPLSMERVRSLSLSREESIDELTQRLGQVQNAIADVRELAESLSREASPRGQLSPRLSFERRPARSGPRASASLSADGADDQGETKEVEVSI